MEFTLDSYFNPHLPAGARRIDAVIGARAIHAGSQPGAALGSGKAVCFIIDASGSMDGEKIRAAKLAARRCVDMLDPSTHFCVIAFSNSAKAIVPMGPADAGRKSSAHQAIQHLGANGGTQMSTALECARDEFAKAKSCIGAAMLLTDGENDKDDLTALKAILGSCQGAFQCDCRGVGSSWRPNELRLVANALGGNADACVDPDGLEADFKAFLARAMGKIAGDARLRLWTPKIARIASVKQMSPEIVDLTSRGRMIDPKTFEFPLGSWGAEARDYHIAIDIPPGDNGGEMIACRASIALMENGVEKIFAAPNVIAAWSDNTTLTARINAQVAHYTGQEKLADSIREGLDALERQDADVATRLLGNAAKIAHDSGNEEVTSRLRKVVDILDADTGTVRLRAGAGKAAALELDMGGTRTVRRRVGVVDTGSPPSDA
jgi:hypothetical protein